MVRLYLLLMPEALVFSMLPPSDFGRYLALGTEKRTRGEAIFIEVDAELLPDDFNLNELRERCRPHADGRPRKSSYVSIYRVLERVPPAALGSLYLVTRDGTSLELKKSASAPPPAADEMFHLYQEICPISPRVVSRLNPVEFASYITRPGQPVSVPRLVFAEFELGPLATDPDSPAPKLPYRNLDHLRYCIREVQSSSKKASKIVERELQSDAPFWLIKGGVYVGDPDGLVRYPMPSEEELRSSDFGWWSSARAVEML